MKEKIFITAIILFSLAAACGCSPSEPEEFDEAALIAVNAYVDEMTAALLDKTLEADLKGWIREPYEDELPLRYDEERREWLGEHAENLEAIHRKHLQGDNFPSEEQIASWQVVVIRGEDEWMMQGGEVLAALEELENLYNDLTGTIEMINNSGGELDLEQSEDVLQLLEEISPRVKDVRAVFHR